MECPTRCPLLDARYFCAQVGLQPRYQFYPTPLGVLRDVLYRRERDGLCEWIISAPDGIAGIHSG